MKAWWRRVRPKVLSGIARFVAKALAATWKIEARGLDKVRALETGAVCAGWHGRTLPAAKLFKGEGVWTITSTSRDGQIVSSVFSAFGFNLIRGSSSDGGVRVTVKAIKVLRKGAMMAFTPDGPRGPSGIVQPGIVAMAQKSGAALVACGVSANRRWIASTWDRYHLPKPFAKVIMIFGEPRYVPKGDDLEQVRAAFEAEMHDLERQAEEACGHKA